LAWSNQLTEVLHRFAVSSVVQRIGSTRAKLDKTDLVRLHLCHALRIALGRGLFSGLKLIEFLEKPFRIGLEAGQAFAAAEAQGPIGFARLIMDVGDDLAGLQVLP